MFLQPYGSELEEVTFPQDGASSAPYAFYDRYAHQFNTATEADTVNEGWGFAAIAAVAASTPAAKQAYVAPMAQIAVPSSAKAAAPVTVTLTAPPGIDLTNARVTWEAAGQEPWVGGTSFTFTPAAAGTIWVDCEAVLPDGRRVIASNDGGLKVGPP